MCVREHWHACACMMEQQGAEPALLDDCNDDNADGALPPPPPPPPPPPSASHESSTRDWGALPLDVLLEIFGRLRHVDILGGAGLACGEWRRAAVEEPTLWRHIDVSFQGNDVISTEARQVRLAMARAAVDRSAGLCESFRCPADRHMLVYLADRAPSLRSLETMTWCLPKEFSDRVITKLPMLERLAVEYGGRILEATLLGLLEHCPRLEVLDVGECCTDEHVELDIMRRFTKKLKFVRLPMYRDRCYCHLCGVERRLAIARGGVE